MYDLLNDFVSETMSLYEEIGDGELYYDILNMGW
jgi:hypothetical protein